MRFWTTIFPVKHKQVSITVLFFLVSGLTASGQNSSVSPYSRYGLGDLQFGGFAGEIAMGGISAGIRHPYQLNYSNPASYAALHMTTFETAVKAQLVKMSTQTGQGNSNTTALSYLALGFPVIKGKWGASFGLIPFSDIGYTIRESQTVSQVGQVNYLFEGTGGINRFYLGTGFTPLKNLSIGINASYLFGTLARTRKIEFPDQPNFFNTQSSVNTNLHDFYFNYGLQYILTLKKEQQLTFGLSGALASNIRTTNDLLTINYVIVSSNIIHKDTIEEQSDYKGKTTLPVSWSGGVVYRKGEKWLAGIDYSFQNWSKFESFGSNDSLQDSYRLSAGAQFVPDASSLRFFRRVQYKAGFRFSQTYLKLNNTPLKDYALNVGFGMPLKIKNMPRILPLITFVVEAGQRGTTSRQLLQEQYLRFHLGISISEEWFLKRKFD